MKAKEIITENIVEISDQDIIDLKAEINNHWDDFYTASELANDIEQGFIFGPYARNKHYTNTYILGLINEIELEKNPPTVEKIPLVNEEFPLIDEEIITPNETESTFSDK